MAEELRYLTPQQQDVKKKKYCRFKKSGIKYIDYKDPEFLKKFLNEQGKILPRRLTGTSLKFQRKVAQAVKRARHLALLPDGTDMMKEKVGGQDNVCNSYSRRREPRLQKRHRKST